MSHDQNIKNLILDYPRQALRFFAADEAADIDQRVTITPNRQEQLEDRVGDRFLEVDAPLLPAMAQADFRTAYERYGKLLGAMDIPLAIKSPPSNDTAFYQVEKARRLDELACVQSIARLADSRHGGCAGRMPALPGGVFLRGESRSVG